ncbi:hypothetical protein RYX36_027950, partial [Vicia faba]
VMIYDFLLQLFQVLHTHGFKTIHHALEGPPMETSTNSLSAKPKKGQKNKRSNHRRSMGELLVLLFLSKFPIPSNSNKQILPLYTIVVSVPHLIASENWVLGELGSCLSEVMIMDAAEPFNVPVNPKAVEFLDDFTKLMIFVHSWRVMRFSVKLGTKTKRTFLKIILCLLVLIGTIYAGVQNDLEDSYETSKLYSSKTGTIIDSEER